MLLIHRFFHNKVYSISLFILFIVPALSMAAPFDTFSANKSHNYITFNCNKNYECMLKAKNFNGQLKKVAKVYLTPSTDILWHGDQLAEIRSGNGTNNAASLFFNFATMRLSKRGFYEVKAVDSKRLVVAYSDEKGILIAPIFVPDVKPLLVTRDFNGGASIGVYRNYADVEPGHPDDDTYFQPNGDLILDYMDSRGKEVKETITVNFTK